jgi:hypothetical protein
MLASMENASAAVARSGSLDEKSRRRPRASFPKITPQRVPSRVRARSFNRTQALGAFTHGRLENGIASGSRSRLTTEQVDGLKDSACYRLASVEL